MRAHLISEVGQLEAWASSYTTLLAHVGGLERLFYTLDWIRISSPTYKLLGASLFFILVEDAGTLAAVLPFQLRRDGLFDLRRTIQFRGTFDMYARNCHQRILAAEVRADAMAAAAACLKNELGSRWDVIEFNWIAMEDDNLRCFAEAFKGASIRSSGGELFYYDGRVDLDHHLGSRRLGSLRRRRRRLEEDHGPVAFGVKDRIDPLDLEELRDLHTARQRQKGDDGGFFTDPVQNAHISELIDYWNRQQCVRYYTLRAAGKLIAFDITCHADGIADSFIIAFDDRYAKYAPSRYLSDASYRHEIEQCGTVRIECGCDSAPDDLKLDYSTHRIPLYNLRITSRRFRSKCVLALIMILHRIRRLCRKTTAASG